MGYDTLVEVLKHLPGEHNQASHAGGRGSAKGATKPASKKPTSREYKSHTDAANAFSNVVGLPTVKTSPLPGHGKFTAERRATVFGNNEKKFGAALETMGFEKYDDPYKTKIVTSYRKGNIKAHVSTHDLYIPRKRKSGLLTEVQFVDTSRYPKQRGLTQSD